MRIGGDAIDVGSQQRGISHLAEDLDSCGSNCETKCDRSAVGASGFRDPRVARGECSEQARPAEPPAASYRPRSGRIVRPNARRRRRNRRCVSAERHLSLGRRSRFVRLELRTQCDRSAVGASGFRDPRVAHLLAALARARPTAIISTAPRSQTATGGHGFDREAVTYDSRGSGR